MAFSFGLKDGTYVGKPTTASCYEKDGKLILDVKFAVKDPASGGWYMKDNGYEFEVMKRHWLTSDDGGFNENTINGIREWAKGWEPASLGDFYWFQQPDANGTPFGNLHAIGEVELNITTDRNGNQQLWVHDPNRPNKGTGRKAFVPEGAITDQAALAAKWGAKAKALFASTPKKVGAGNAPQAAQKPVQAAAAPSRAPAPAAAPTRPAAPSRAPAAAAEPWAEFPKTADGAYAFYATKVEGLDKAVANDKWFELIDQIKPGADGSDLDAGEVQRLFQLIAETSFTA